MYINFNNLSKLHEHNETKLIKLSIKILSLMFLFYMINLLFIISKESNFNILDLFNGIFKDTRIILSFLAFISCFLYYYSSKKYELFIITLFYFNIFVEVLLVGLINFNSAESTIDTFFLLNALLRLCFLLLTFTNNKVKNLITKNKIKIFFLSFMFTIVFVFIESNSTLLINLKTSTSCFYIIGILLLINIGIILKLVNKAINNHEPIYVPIIASITFFNIKFIYTIALISSTNLTKFKALTGHFSYLALLMVISGMFIELLRKVKKSELLEKNFRVFFDLCENDTSKGILILDSKGSLVYCNNKLYEDLNLDKSEKNKTLIAREINNRLPIDTLIDINFKLNNCKSIKKNIIDISNSAVFRTIIQRSDIHKNEYIYFITLENIIEEYNFTEKLKRNEDELRSITENIDDFIINLKDDIITYINTSALEALNYTKEELEGQSIYKILKLSSLNRELSSNRDSSKSLCFHTLTTKEGTDIAVGSHIKTLDISNNSLNQIIIARNFASKNELDILKSKYKEAQEYDQIKNEFFANLSHELRTPINILYSCLQLINSNSDTKMALYQKYEPSLKQNCFRMLRLVNNLIDITKIDSGFIKCNFINCDIIRLVEDISMSIIPYVESKKINVIFDTDIEELDIYCDPDKIERIILNLLSNAIKFTDINGNILIDISHDKDWVNIKVKDDGIGIPPHMSPFIFDRFIQTDKSLKRSKEGSGIGLSLVKSLVNFHNGSIHLNTRVEKGTEFIIKLPNKIMDNIETKSPSTDYTPAIEQISIEFSDIYDI